MDKAREIALKALHEIDENQAYSNIALNELLKQNKQKINEKDVGLISQIVYGVTTWKLTLDEIIKKYSKIRIKKISPWILNIIRMGAYQIIFLDKIPKSAAVNESVNLAKRYGHKGSSNFTNAILRKITKEDYEELFNIKNEIKRISLTTSMPEWIVEKLLQEKSEKEVEQICKNSNLNPKLTIRINNLKTNKQDFEQKLKERNITFEETELDSFLVIEKLKNIENLDLFKQGEFTVQDISAGLAAFVLNPKPGEIVLDSCSAPGGKTTYLAELMKNKGKIQAWDIYKHRVNLIKENARRLGIDIIQATIDDATKLNKAYIEKFDKILLDVPCMGLGVIKRKPDIKWKRKEEDIKNIAKIQLEILNTCSKYLKKGGELVYSTCSILKEENQNIVQAFLEQNKEYDYSNYEDLKINKLVQDFLHDKKYIEISTQENYDGFFICKMTKK